jgi:ABC-type dipeptide/oligopeptide/nickel transport system permease component
MKNYKRIIHKSLPITLTAIFFTIFSAVALGQLPTDGVSPEAKPVDFFGSTSNIVLYVVIPFIVVILFILWRVRINKHDPKEDQ